MTKKPISSTKKKVGPKKQPESPPAAFAIYKKSNGRATGDAIAKELSAAGHRTYTGQAVNGWKRAEKWSERLAHGTADASEDVRHRLSVVRVPEDLALVEQASLKLYAVGLAAAENLLKQIDNVKVTTPSELEQYARACTSILTTHFEVAKGMEELARRRIGSFSDGNAEITPPRESRPAETKNEVISRFAEARQAH